MDKRTIYRGMSIITFMFMSALLSYGQQRYVDNYGNDHENTCSNPDKPCRSIQHAVDTASMGATIRLSAGIYTESVYIDKDLTLLGAGAHRTIIQAADKMEDAQSRVLHLDIPFGQKLFVHIEGVPVQNGRAVGQFPVNQGGGILNLPMNGELTQRIDTGELMSGTYYIRLWDAGKFASGTFMLVK